MNTPIVRFANADDASTMTRYAHAVHIVCAVYNGAQFLPEFLKSVQTQSVTNWLLWIRDDTSTDLSVTVIRGASATDERVRLLEASGDQLGPAGAFSWLLERVPENAPYIMFADQDDVWLPNKIEYTLSAMNLAEQSELAVMVHTDMTVVDQHLKEIDPSFWHFAHIDPQYTKLEHLAVQNVATGATVMINRALRERVGRIPSAAAMHDWWIALVASAFGHILAISTPTMLYRQHAANAIGATKPASALSLTEVPSRITGAFARVGKVRADISKAARQAGAFAERYGSQLSEEQRRFLTDYARIPTQGFFRRKIEIARLHLRADKGFLWNAGLLLRA